MEMVLWNIMAQVYEFYEEPLPPESILVLWSPVL